MLPIYWLKTSFLMLFSLIFLLIFLSCNKKKITGANHQHDQYTCPMHPQVIADEPGACPICKMPLEKRLERKENIVSKADNSIKTIANSINNGINGNYEVINPLSNSSPEGIKTDGFIGFDETEINNISARVSGRIEKLFVKYENQPVKKGQLLMQIYSPELSNTQRDLLLALKNNDYSLLSLLKSRLINLGMNAPEINHVIKQKKISDRVNIYSPYSGMSHVFTPANSAKKVINSDEMNAGSAQTFNANLLTVQEGSYVNLGQTLFSIANHDQLWAILQLPSSHLNQLKINAPVKIQPLYNVGKEIKGKVNQILPYQINNENKVRIRVYLNNEHQLPVGTLIKATIANNDIKTGLYLPKSAVLNLGSRRIVWVETFINKQKTYRYKEVQTGIEAGENILITSGLDKKDKVIKEAALLAEPDAIYGYDNN